MTILQGSARIPSQTGNTRMPYRQVSSVWRRSESSLSVRWCLPVSCLHGHQRLQLMSCIDLSSY